MQVWRLSWPDVLDVTVEVEDDTEDVPLESRDVLLVCVGEVER